MSTRAICGANYIEITKCSARGGPAAERFRNVLGELANWKVHAGRRQDACFRTKTEKGIAVRSL